MNEFNENSSESDDLKGFAVVNQVETQRVDQEPQSNAKMQEENIPELQRAEDIENDPELGNSSCSIGDLDVQNDREVANFLGEEFSQGSNRSLKGINDVARELESYGEEFTNDESSQTFDCSVGEIEKSEDELGSNEEVANNLDVNNELLRTENNDLNYELLQSFGSIKNTKKGDEETENNVEVLNNPDLSDELAQNSNCSISKAQKSGTESPENNKEVINDINVQEDEESDKNICLDSKESHNSKIKSDVNTNDEKNDGSEELIDSKMTEEELFTNLNMEINNSIKFGESIQRYLKA